MPKAITNPLLNPLSGIGHAFFTRHDGISEGIYEGLNCSTASKDDPASIHENRRRALAHLGLSIDSLASYEAVHGNEAIIVNSMNLPYPKADAIVTNHSGIVLGADSADCPTVFMVDPIAQVIGLAHAGWRSALRGILEATYSQMQSLGASANQMIAVIGPGIAQCSYEVSQPFYQQFCEAHGANARFFIPSHRNQHWMFDLPGYIEARLRALQIGQIADMRLNTYLLEDDFYSCRRSNHQGKADFGGHWACLYLTGG